jgi:hypothetical protein
MHKRLEARYQDRLQEAVVELIGCVVDMLVRDEGTEEDERAFQEREAVRFSPSSYLWHSSAPLVRRRIYLSFFCPL